MSVYLLALLIGIIAGLRTMTAPAAVAWATYLGRLDLSGTWLAFLGNVWVRWILTALALVELVIDQLPSTASRTVPVQFGARILTGASPARASGPRVGLGLAGFWPGPSAQSSAPSAGAHSARSSPPRSAATAPPPSSRTRSPSAARC